MPDDVVRAELADAALWRLDALSRGPEHWGDLEGVWAHSTGLPLRPWNGGNVVRHLDDPTAAVRRTAAWFQQRSLPWGVVVPSHVGQPLPLLEPLKEQPLMLRPMDRPLPVVDVPLVSSPPVEDVALVQAEGFGDPYDLALAFVDAPLRAGTLHAVVAYDGDAPVSTAAVSVADGVAGVFGVATRAGWRRRGLGRACTVAVLQLAVERGADLAYLNPSEEGYGVYASLGFRDAPPSRIWAPADGDAVPSGS